MRPYWKGYLKFALVSCPVALGNGLSVADAFRDGGDAVELHGLTDVFHSGGEMDLILVG